MVVLKVSVWGLAALIRLALLALYPVGLCLKYP